MRREGRKGDVMGVIEERMEKRGDNGCGEAGLQAPVTTPPLLFISICLAFFRHNIY